MSDESPHPEFEKLCSLAHFIVTMAGLLIMIAGLLQWFGYGKDDTDSRTTNERSGLSLHKDYGTGCEFLRRGDAIIARVDGTGKHVGCTR